MSFQISPTTHQIVISCDVCGKQIEQAEDGKVEWNDDQHFVFAHFDCSNDVVFNPKTFQYWQPLNTWLESLAGAYELIEPSEDFSVMTAEEAAELRGPKPLYPLVDSDTNEDDWAAMTADQLCNLDLSKKKGSE